MSPSPPFHNSHGGGGGDGRSTIVVVGGGSSSSSLIGELKKGPWSASEDAILIDYVHKHGEGNWNELQRNTSLLRCGKSCRLRWTNHLRPNLKKGAFSIDEERIIVNLHSKLGNKWARISSHLPGRTDNEVKNYWNTRVKRRLRHGLPLYSNQNHLSTSPPPQPISLPLLKSPTPPPPPPFLFNPPPPSSSATQLPFLSGTATSCCFQSNPWSSSDLGFMFDPDPTQLTTPTSALELPSNQFRNQLTADEKFNYPNLLQTNSPSMNTGLLDSLLLESRYRTRVDTTTTTTTLPKKEKLEFDDCFYAGEIKIEQDHGSSNSDLSTIFNHISSSSSSSPTPNWCHSSHQQPPDEYYQFDQMPPLHSPSDDHYPEWLDDTNGILSFLGIKFTS